MNFRSLCAVLFLATATLVSADPRTAAGSTSGPVVALLSAADGSVNLLHEGSVVRGWVFPGPFTVAVVLAGPLDTVEWEGEAAVLLPGGANPLAAAQKALVGQQAPRLVVITADGASQVVRAAPGEETMDYDAASAATSE